MYWTFDAAGFVTGTTSVPGIANSTAVPPPEGAAQPLRFVDGVWLMPPPAPLRHITQLAFFRRFTGTERIAIIDRQTGDANVRDFLFLADRGKFIDLDDQDVAMGLHYLVSLQLLTAERAEEILGAEVTDAERP